MATQASIDAIQKLYISFYQRPADVTGLEYWANRADAANGNMSAIVNAFATSAEATANYGSLNTNQLVNTIYTSLFGRAPDAAGLNFYSNAIAAGTMTPGQLALNILDGATGADATIVANKLTVAKAYTTAMDTTAEILAYSNAAAQTNAKNLLGAVNALDSSVTNATNQIPAVMVSNVNNAAATIAAAGTTFTFTASPLDAFTGNASGNNMVSGAFADIQGTDRVNGGAGNGDTLTLTTAATGAGLTFVATTGAATAQAEGFEKLVLANGTNTITMSGVIQNSVGAAASGAGVNSFHTITGGTGYDVIVTAGVSNKVNLSTVTGIEQFDAASATTDITFSGAGLNGQIVNTGAAAVDVAMGNFVNNVNVLGTGAAAVTVAGGNTVDTVTLNGAVAGTSVTTYNVETVNGSAAGGTVLLNGALLGGVAVAAGTGGATAGSVAATFNSAANTGAQTITGTAFADMINLSASASAGNVRDTIDASTAGFISNITAMDTIANFKAVGNDAFDTTAAVTSVTNLTIASATTAGLASAIASAAIAAGDTLSAAGQAYFITVNGGTAAGTYVLQNTTGDTAVTAGDFMVKLTGTIGSSIIATDFI